MALGTTMTIKRAASGILVVIGLLSMARSAQWTGAKMTLDAGEAAIRTVIAAALAQHSDANGRGLDALMAMRQAEAVTKALEYAGYEIRRRI
jgi:hypothetical protein